MSPTIEERLARYTARLDQAASDYTARSARPVPNALLATPEHRSGRGPGRRLVAAAVVACVVAVAGFAISSSRSKHNVNVSTVTSDATGPATTSPDSTTTPTTTAPTTTTLANMIPPPPPPGTAQITYQPFTANGIDPALHVTARLRGTCIRDHERTRDYFRCFANPSAAIYDPCFAGPHGAAEPLVCPRDPSTVDVVELTATSVTSDPPTSLTRPWAMQLANGQVCQFVAAAWGGLGPYGCESTGAAQPISDCREPVAAQPWWTAECQEQLTDSSPFASSRVVKVWY